MLWAVADAGTHPGADAYSCAHADAHAEFFVRLLVNQHVLGRIGAERVPPHLVGAPRVVHADVEQVVLPRPGRAVEDAL